MKIDDNGNYILFSDDITNIDYYISESVGYQNVIKSLLRKDPETRKAILNSRYKDLLCLRVQIEEIAKLIYLLDKRGILQASRWEAECAAGEHPDTYGND